MSLGTWKVLGVESHRKQFETMVFRGKENSIGEQKRVQRVVEEDLKSLLRDPEHNRWFAECPKGSQQAAEAVAPVER